MGGGGALNPPPLSVYLIKVFCFLLFIIYRSIEIFIGILHKIGAPLRNIKWCNAGVKRRCSYPRVFQKKKKKKHISYIYILLSCPSEFPVVKIYVLYLSNLIRALFKTAAHS